MVMNKNIVEYMICVKEDVRSLGLEVSKQITFGWQPYGFVFLDFNEDHCQAMVKYETN
tara:strand:- start:584 stop:757 length:174 start_codon:yes stop_codon:yes gene_type:complete